MCGFHKRSDVVATHQLCTADPCAHEGELHQEPAHPRHPLGPSEVLRAILDFARDERSADEGAGQCGEHDETVLSEVESENRLGDLPERVAGQAGAEANGSWAAAGRDPELQRDITNGAAEQHRKDKRPERFEPMLPPGNPGHDAASSSWGLGNVTALGAER